MPIKNGQSIDTGNIGYIIHRTKTIKAQKHKTENQTDELHGPHQNPWVTSGASE